MQHYNKNQIDKHRSMVILGRAGNSKMANEIAYVSSPDEAEKLYGDNDLTDSFKTAYKFGAKNIFLVNLSDLKQSIEAVNILKDYDFTYIVPIIPYISDRFTFTSGVSNHFYDYFMKTLSGKNDSILVATDNHASLYEDMDQYLNSMFDIKNELCNKILNNPLYDLHNLYFVLNNLENYKYSNVVFAASLASVDYSEYPNLDYGPAIFSIDNNEVGDQSVIYFKNNYLRYTTVENAVNFGSGPQRSILADRIVKYLIKELDLSRFRGKLLTNYQRARVEEYIIDFLERNKGFVIEDYAVRVLRMDREGAGAVSIKVHIDIIPVNFKEKVEIKVDA